MVTIRLRTACCHEVGHAPDKAWRSHLARIDLRSRLAGNRVCLCCCKCLCILHGCAGHMPVLVRGAQCYGRLPSLLAAGRSLSLLYCHALATCPAAWFSLPTVWMYLDLVTWFLACWWYGLIWYTRGRGILLMGIEARGAL